MLQRRVVTLGLTHSYYDSLKGLYADARPGPAPRPELVVKNQALLDELEIDLDDETLAQVFSGAQVPRDARPLAMAYAGHQFGYLSPQLGDGRALLYGELKGKEIQLKGSGRTPFSRGGDGLCTLGPALREFLVSEAMHALGVRTTRCLCVVKTGRARAAPRAERAKVGHLDAAVVTRVADSHLRVGTLEFFAARRDVEALERLVCYAGERFDIAHDARALLEFTAERQAQLIASWMNVGFIHGVMNTDNFALSGETLDFGPCAFMDASDPHQVFSSIDRHGRYAYGAQPEIGRWNLERMADALSPLLSSRDLDFYDETYERAWLAGLREKAGRDLDATEARAFMKELEGKDFTQTFRELSEQNPLYIPRNHLVEEALAAANEGDLDLFLTLYARVTKPFERVSNMERYEEPAPDAFGPYQTFCGT